MYIISTIFNSNKKKKKNVVTGLKLPFYSFQLHVSQVIKFQFAVVTKFLYLNFVLINCF